MTLIIPDETVQATQMTPDELRRDIAIWLFAQDRLTLSQASSFAQVDVRTFMQILAHRQIPLHYDQTDFDTDVALLRTLGEL